MYEMNKIMLNLWDGDPNTYYSNNLFNFQVIQNFINNWNKMDNDYIENIAINLDLTDNTLINRAAYQQTINNFKLINQALPNLIESYRLTDFDYVFNVPAIPDETAFDKQLINNYWNTINQGFNFMISQVNAFIN